ncbi:MAG: DUF819 family protein, partial [Gemmatimonadota bacterium]|nr:DUF819 family protein [Gemmatimonadota bacterium]
MIRDPTAVFFVLAAVVAVAVTLEARHKFFRSLGSALVGILLAMVLSNSGIIPGDSSAYVFLGGPAVSAGIALILLSVDVRTVIKAGPTMLAAFAVGAVGSAIGASVAAYVLADSIGLETWKLAGQYTATYTGGGANFAAVGAELGTSGELFAAAIAADVILTAIWMAICLAVPVMLGSRLATASASVGRPGARPPSKEALHPETQPSASDGAERMLYSSVGDVGLVDLAALAVIVLGTLWASDVLGQSLAPVPGVLWLTTIALLLAQIPAVQRLRGAGVIGNYLVLLFLASNGARSVVANIFAVGLPVVYFAAMTVAIHGIVIFGLGRVLRLDLRTLAVASQANVGGPASAMALAT